MKAMIFAAGRGERMRPLTDTTPKPLLKVGGLSLIEYHLKGLALAGFAQVVINNCWLGAQIEQNLGKQYMGMTLMHKHEPIALETAGGIANALDDLDDAFAVINGDVFCPEFNYCLLNDLITQFKQNEYDEKLDNLAHLLLVNNPNHNLNGDFYLSNIKHQPSKKPLVFSHEKDLIINLEQNKQSMQTFTNAGRYTFSGLGVYSKQLFLEIYQNYQQNNLNQTSKQPVKLATLLRKAMQQNSVTGDLFEGLWMDIGTPERLLDANTWIEKLAV